MSIVRDLSKIEISEYTDQELRGKLALLGDTRVDLLNTLKFVNEETATIVDEVTRRGSL